MSKDGSDNKIAHFKLPANIKIRDNVCASMEPFVEEHPSADKQALRNQIKKEIHGPVGKLPVEHMMSKIEDKVAFICENEVLYFRPLKCVPEERKLEETFQLETSKF